MGTENLWFTHKDIASSRTGIGFTALTIPQRCQVIRRTFIRIRSKANSNAAAYHEATETSMTQLLEFQGQIALITHHND
jgi:hypothetical protein